MSTVVVGGVSEVKVLKSYADWHRLLYINTVQRFFMSSIKNGTWRLWPWPTVNKQLFNITRLCLAATWGVQYASNQLARRTCCRNMSKSKSVSTCSGWQHFHNGRCKACSHKEGQDVTNAQIGAREHTLGLLKSVHALHSEIVVWKLKEESLFKSCILSLLKWTLLLVSKKSLDTHKPHWTGVGGGGFSTVQQSDDHFVWSILAPL